MTTVIDTNVIVALWDRDLALSTAAQSALDAALQQGALIVPAPVFAELMAAPGRNERFLDAFFRDTGILVDWNLDQRAWRMAGRRTEVRRGTLKRAPRCHLGRPRNVETPGRRGLESSAPLR